MASFRGKGVKRGAYAPGFRLEGEDDLRRALNRLNHDLREEILKEALLAAAKPIVQRARAAAPRKTGTLMRSIVADEGKAGKTDKYGAYAWVKVGPGPETEVSYFERDTRRRKTSKRIKWRSVGGRSGARVGTRLGRDRTLSYGLFPEFGVGGRKKKAYLFPAVTAGKAQFLSILRLRLRRILLARTR